MISSLLMKTIRSSSSSSGGSLSSLSSISSMRMTMSTPAVASVTGGGNYDSSTTTLQQLRWKSSSNDSNNNGSSSGKKSSSSTFRPRRAPAGNRKGGNNGKGNGYYYNRHTENGKLLRKQRKESGIKEPFDIKTPIPKINKSQIKVTDCLLDADENEDDDLTELGTLMGGALRSLRAEQQAKESNSNSNSNASSQQQDELEKQLRVMDFFISADGSTEDLIGSRRAVTADSPLINADTMLDRIDSLVDQERFDYMELPKTDHITQADILKGNDASSGKGGGNTIGQIPANQLAHGDWGEMLIRTDRVSKMWRGGRVVSFRALVIGGNTKGCGGFGLGKAFEPEDAVEIACRMAKRNIFFVDRFRNMTITRDLVGRQNSCKVQLRVTNNGLRGNPLCCEILKLFGITNVVAKAHGSRNHYNVVRATFKALLTHESLDDIAMKRGIRLVNLEKAKRLGI